MHDVDDQGAGPGWSGALSSPSPWVRRPWMWRVVAAAFLFWLLPVVLDAWHSPHSLAYRLVVLAGLGVYCLVYVAVWPSGQRPDTSRRWWLVLLMLGLVLTAVRGPGSIGILMFVLIAGAAALPANRAFLMLGSILVAMVAYTGFSDEGPQWSEVVIFGSITVMMIALMGNVRSIRELQAAREELAHLAVAEERSRMARDLHDVLGHSLTTITMKSALARRLTESGDTTRAAAEITDVERLSRQVLTDVRATVSARRQASLPGELVGARAVLDAAGIEAVLPQATEDVRAEYREVFAYVLREGVTNVVRHSGARRCEVRLGPSWVEVRDDGVGNRQNGGGSGLLGLRERLTPLGGTLAVEDSPDGGFCLRAAVGAP